MNERGALLETVGRLYVAGVEIDWTALRQGRPYTKARLPAYPFQRRRYWFQLESAASNPASGASSLGDQPRDPLLGVRMPLPGSDEIRFAVRYSAGYPTYLNDHRLFGIPVAPGASHFAMLAQAANVLGDDEPACFDSLYLVKPLIFPDSEARDLQLVFGSDEPGWNLQLMSTPADTNDWVVHMVGQARTDPTVDASTDGPNVADFVENAPTRLAGAEFYTRIWANQGGTGDAFRWIDAIWRDEGQALCRTACPPAIADHARFRLHPGLIEAACQVLHCCGTIETAAGMNETGITYVPFSVERFRVFGSAPTAGATWCHGRLRRIDESEVVGDLTILSEQSDVIAQLIGFCLRPIACDALEAGAGRGVPPKAVTGGHRTTGATPVPPEAPVAPDRDAVFQYLQRQCARLSGHDPSRIGADVSLIGLGLDSMAVVTLTNCLKRDLAVNMNAAQVLGSPSIDSLTDDIVADLDRSARKQSD
jgi:acyl transferase domain-containing protein/aryl carrier-like protein